MQQCLPLCTRYAHTMHTLCTRSANTQDHFLVCFIVTSRFKEIKERQGTFTVTCLLIFSNASLSNSSNFFLAASGSAAICSEFWSVENPIGCVHCERESSSTQASKRTGERVLIIGSHSGNCWMRERESKREWVCV
jgi:hypothetical protein